MRDVVFERQTEPALPDLEDLLHDVASDDATPIIDHAIEHELATAAFYETLVTPPEDTQNT